MNTEMILNKNEELIVNGVYDEIKVLIENSRKKIYQTVNTEMLSLYWSIGKRIMEI